MRRDIANPNTETGRHRQGDRLKTQDPRLKVPAPYVLRLESCVLSLINAIPVLPFLRNSFEIYGAILDGDAGARIKRRNGREVAVSLVCGDGNDISLRRRCAPTIARNASICRKP